MEPNAIFLRVEETARVLALGRSKVYELMLSGELRSLKVGRARRIPVEALNEYVAKKLAE